MGSEEKNQKISQDTDQYLPFGDAAKDYYFKKELLDAICTYEKTVEFIGIIKDVEFKPKLLKFTVGNENGDLIQCVAWDESIKEKIKNIISDGNIIHIDAGFARVKNQKYSASTAKHDITIMSNTVVTLLQSSPSNSYEFDSQNKAVIQNVSIEDCLKHVGCIEVVGFIKNPIRETSLPDCKINQGCISDCNRYKLEVRMPTLCDMSEFVMGAHVKIVGTIKCNNSQYPYLWVLQKSDVSIQSDEKKKIYDLLKGTKMPKRPLDSA